MMTKLCFIWRMMEHEINSNIVVSVEVFIHPNNPGNRPTFVWERYIHLQGATKKSVISKLITSYVIAVGLLSTRKNKIEFKKPQ